MCRIRVRLNGYQTPGELFPMLKSRNPFVTVTPCRRLNLDGRRNGVLPLAVAHTTTGRIAAIWLSRHSLCFFALSASEHLKAAGRQQYPNNDPENSLVRPVRDTTRLTIRSYNKSEHEARSREHKSMWHRRTSVTDGTMNFFHLQISNNQFVLHLPQDPSKDTGAQRWQRGCMPPAEKP